MKIAFFANYEKTICFHQIAVRLVAAGHEVFWISPSGHWAQWLADQGVAPAAILDLSRFGEEWAGRQSTEEDRDHLARLEETGGLRCNDVILMDRVMRPLPYEENLRYLAVVSRHVARFIAEHDLRFVFGEQTFGAELITGMVCRGSNVEFLAPHVVRIPTGLMGFFRGHLQAELFPLRDVTDADVTRAREFLVTFRRDRPRPDYFLRNLQQPRPRWDWPAKLARHAWLEVADRFDRTHVSPRWLVRLRASEVTNALYHRVSQPYWVPPETPERPFVLFTLHRQPEASIDVLGARISNQVELVRALARTLPATHELYVKEHPNGRGDRSPAMMRELASIPGVRLVDPGVSSFALAETAALTIVVSGTAAYEAALMGRRAVALAPMFFGDILAAPAFDPYRDSLATLLRDATCVDDDRLVARLAAIIASSFPGLVDNPRVSPQVLEPENLDSVAAGLQMALVASPRAS